MTEEKTVTITQAEYDRLRAIEKAAQRAIQSAIVRKTSKKWHDTWLRDMNGLAVLVPATRRFDRDPLT